MERYLILRYHEIALKQGNRAFFEGKLQHNVERALEGLEYEWVRRISGRLLLKLNGLSPLPEIKEGLRHVFGIVHFSQSWRSSQDLDQLQADAWELIRHRSFGSFKIEAKRAEKSLPYTSPQVNQRVGAFVQARSGARVDLTHPELTCFIDLAEKYALIYFEKERGPGGLPTSTGGRVMALLSGGIDSPVASYKVMKRGCKVHFVHFHSFPHTSQESQEKAKQIVRLLTRYQFDCRLYLVPFAEIQRQIVAFAQPKIRVVLYRRFMARIATALARPEGASALVTGESIGQVASQTLENIQVISQATSLPILRPLVGDDKEEIVELARQIGTYPISILPDQDCCSLFIPPHPETRAELGPVEEAESHLAVGAMVDAAVSETELQLYTHAPQWAPELKP
ncbi:MAG: tRNA 4-thiouridine(8) synthase ThiI [Acidobacteria bacterium]|nr:tRNA 4-thiouridine(8) synthase ThiI [Acidobacteriota bacterium]